MTLIRVNSALDPAQGSVKLTVEVLQYVRSQQIAAQFQAHLYLCRAEDSYMASSSLLGSRG